MQGQPQLHRFFSANCLISLLLLVLVDDVCDHLTDAANNDANDKVQATVNNYQLYGRYIDDIPQMLISLYLGPLSGKSRNNLFSS